MQHPPETVVTMERQQHILVADAVNNQRQIKVTGKANLTLKDFHLAGQIAKTLIQSTFANGGKSATPKQISHGFPVNGMTGHAGMIAKGYGRAPIALNQEAIVFPLHRRHQTGVITVGCIYPVTARKMHVGVHKIALQLTGYVVMITDIRIHREYAPMHRIVLLFTGSLITCALSIPAHSASVSTYDPDNPNIGFHGSLGGYIPQGDGDSQFTGHISYDNDDVLGSGDGFSLHLNPDELIIRLTDRGYVPYSPYTILTLSSHLTKQDMVEYSDGNKVREEQYTRQLSHVELGRGMHFAPHIRGELAFGLTSASYGGTTGEAPDPEDEDAVGDGFLAPADGSTYHLRGRLIAGRLTENMHYQPKTSHVALLEIEQGQRSENKTWGAAGGYGAPGKSFGKYTLLMRGYNNYPRYTLGYRFMMGLSSGLDRDNKFRLGGDISHQEHYPRIPGWFHDEIAAKSYYLGSLFYSQNLMRFDNSFIVGFWEVTAASISNSSGDGTTNGSGTILGASAGLSIPSLLAGRLTLQVDYSPDTDHDGIGILARYDKKF